jgi:hypothetical protein
MLWLNEPVEFCIIPHNVAVRPQALHGNSLYPVFMYNPLCIGCHIECESVTGPFLGLVAVPVP